MARFFYFCLAIFLAMSITHAQSINGQWKGEMQSPNGPFDLTFNFKVSGDSLTGSVTSQMGEIPISNGKFNDTTFSFDVDVNEMTIHHKCIVKSDSTISMTVEGMQGEPSEIILKRVPESKDESK
jgi:hypothetical protein